MKRRINSIFLVMFALLTSHGIVSAQTRDVVFENVFSSPEIVDQWTEEGDIPEMKTFLDYEGATSMFIDIDNWTYGGKTGYVVSPSFTLGAEGNEVSFNHKCYGFDMTAMPQCAQLVIRETGSKTWTNIDVTNYPVDKNIVNSGDLAIAPEFNGKNVQVAFKVTGNMNSYQMWYIESIKVTAAGAPEPQKELKTLFEKAGNDLFNATFNGFTIEGYTGIDDWNTVWNFNTWDGPFGADPQFIVEGDTNIESYFVSPVIRMHEENSIEILHSVIGYAEGEAEKHLAICIREEGSKDWEVINGTEFFADGVEDYSQVDVDAKYNDKNVQFGFKYTAEDKATAGKWHLAGITVYGLAPEAAEANISYDVTELEYALGSRKPFEEPVLNNPNNIKVTYEVDNWEVASVDATTGKLSLNGKEGIVKVTAKAPETIEFHAGEASYTLKVYDPILIKKFEFNESDAGFKESEGSSIWKFNYGNIAAENPVEKLTTSYYVSPEVELDAKNNLVSFIHASQGIANLKDHAGLCIRTIGGEWTELPVENWPKEDGFWWDYVNSGDILIPSEFNGKKVEFAFKFTADETTFAENVGSDWTNVKWAISSLLITKYVERADAGLSFDKPEITYYMGEIPFVAPTINNPNELEVKYSVNSEGSDFVSVDQMTGEVTILDAGVATITAKSEKNLEFNAGEASYTLNVTDLTIIFRHRFGKDGLGEFTQEGSEGLWSFDGYVNTGACTNTELADGTKGYLVSPVIKLDVNGNKASWKENGYNCDFEKQALFAVREVGGEWTEISNIDRTGEDQGGMKTVTCDIPEQFNGKDVQVAFLFIQGDPNNWQSWNINDLKIMRNFVKIDPALAFDKETASYVKGEDFTAPVLSNPENVKVTYTTSDVLVATVNELTGALEIIGEGSTVITASSEEDNKYKAGSASYTLSVSFVPSGINGVSIDMNNAKIYDLQGNRIQNVVKGNIYIINGKKVLVK